MTAKRPIGVTLIAFLAILGVVNAFIVTLQFLHILPVYVRQVAFYTFSLLGAFLALIFLALFQMLWTMQPQGWMFAWIFAALTLVFDLIAILGGTSWRLSFRRSFSAP